MEFLGIAIDENKLGRMAYLALLGPPISYLLFYHMHGWNLFQWMQRDGVHSQKFGVWAMTCLILLDRKRKDEVVVPREHPAVKAMK